MAEIKKQVFCNGYKIYVDMEGGVHVEYDGSEVETGKTKSVLREISEKAGFSYEDKWNTRQLGGKLIDFLNGEKGEVQKSSDLKEFTIKISTKGTVDIEFCMLKFEDGMDKDVALDDIYNDGWDIVCPEGVDQGEMEYIASNCIADEFDGLFQLEVFDENEKLVYKVDDGFDIQLVSPWDYQKYMDSYYECDEDIPDEETAKRINDTMLEKANKDVGFMQEGYCVVCIHETKWRNMEFKIEDNKFSVNKLLFVQNPGIEGAGFDYYSDSDHIMYGDQFLENICEEDVDEYGTYFYLAQIKKYGNKHCFEIIRKLEDDCDDEEWDEEDLVIKGDFVNNSEETDKQNESKSQEKKYFNIFLNYIGGAVGSFDKDEMLKALKYKDLDEMWEEYSIGLAGECDDYETFIYKVQSIFVEESKTKFENPLLTNSDGGEEYDDGFEIDYFEIPQKGYVVEQYEGPFTKAFIIEVDASEEFDIEELCVNSENEITYKGEKYSSVADDCGSSCGYGGRLSYDGEVLYDDIDSGLDDDDDDDDFDDEEWD